MRWVLSEDQAGITPDTPLQKSQPAKRTCSDNFHPLDRKRTQHDAHAARNTYRGDGRIGTQNAGNWQSALGRALSNPFPNPHRIILSISFQSESPFNTCVYPLFQSFPSIHDTDQDCGPTHGPGVVIITLYGACSMAGGPARWPRAEWRTRTLATC